MKIMPCPLNGPRNIQEFAYGGEVVTQPDALRCSDDEWAAYVFLEDNRSDVVQEWWCHVASAFWFIAERDRSKDEILRTYPASELFKERVDFRPLEPAPEPPEPKTAEPPASAPPAPAPPAPAPPAPPVEPAPVESESAAPASEAPSPDAPTADKPAPDGEPPRGGAR